MAGRAHFPFVDLVKAVAAQLIVLHHLAWFGPMSDVAAQGIPLLQPVQSWLANYGRYAVAAFLAIGGYLAAQSLPLHGLPADSAPLRLVLQRYLRLVGPFAAALVLAVACAAIARRLMVHDSIGSPATVGQFVAHLLLLHSLLDVESLSAGVWYVAIDFQLYALLVLLLWLAGKFGRRLPGTDFAAPLVLLLVLGVALASLLWFSRDDGWDATALYFFGAYAFGVVSGWAVQGERPGRLLALVALVGAVALAFDYRGRIAMALATALAAAWVQLRWRQPAPALLSALGGASYALFLVHFPVCLVANALFTHYAPASPAFNLVGVLLAWAASNAAAFAFRRYIEARFIFRLPGPEN